ncbi:MAG: c-type cytochrome [Chloroflexota bacterium]|nr:c-type cytochrome [Chloroflexota bacterium]
MKRAGIILGILAVLFLGLVLLAACARPAPTPAPVTPTQPTTPAAPAPATVALGGKLYDNWMKTAQIATPKENSPLWATQTTNTRTGSDTWRCKECHGWDYKGKDGAYGKGSHLTGFPGVYGAATTKTVAELTSILKGSTNSNHNFSTYLNAEQTSALAAFLKVGAVLDETQYIDYATKKPKSADAAKGKQLFESSCAACHGVDGKTLNFGSPEKPEYVGTIAIDNPWEFLHKVRFGQPGTAMPTGVEQQWSIQNVIDMLSHSQTLPQK